MSSSPNSPKHYSGEWFQSPKCAGAVIAPSVEEPCGSDHSYYGGTVVCETVNQRNMPLICAAPRLYRLAEALAKAAAAVPRTLQAYDVVRNLCDLGQDAQRELNAIAIRRGTSPEITGGEIDQSRLLDPAEIKGILRLSAWQFSMKEDGSLALRFPVGETETQYGAMPNDEIARQALATIKAKLA